MPTVRYLVQFEPEDRPTVLPPDSRAVLSDTCEAYDIGQGGVTAEEVNPDDVQSLGVFPVASELFIESSNPGDCLDDTDDETSKLTRIWWRAVVLGPEET